MNLPECRRLRHRRQPSPWRAVALAAALAASGGAANAVPVTWIGPNNGFWAVLGNWNPAALPGLTADVALGVFDTALRSGTASINSLAGTGRLTVSGGSLVLASASSIGALTLTGGGLSGAGALTVAGASTWTGGQMTGAGNTTFNGAMALSGNDTRIVTSRNVNFAGTSTWTNSANSGGQFYTGSSATLTNSGTFLDQTIANTGISNAYGGPASSCVNIGTYTKSGASTTDIAGCSCCG